MADDFIKPNKLRNLTIGLVCDFFYPNVGGVESHIYQLAQCLILRGHRVIVITHSYGKQYKRQGVRHMVRGLKIYYIPYRPFYNSVILITVYGTISVIRDIIIRENIDILHGHSAFSPLAMEALMHAKALGLRTVFTDHSLFGFADLPSILANKALQMALNCVDVFVCVSHVSKENTNLRGCINPHRVFVIPNAVDPLSFTPDPTAIDPNNVTVIIISRLVYRKGIDLLAAVMPPLCATFPNIKFIIGGDGPKRIILEETRERYNLHSRIQLLGPLPHHKVREVLIKGDIFLNTSLTDAFCIAMIEAASCGLLVVSTAVGGIPEVLPPHLLRLAPASASGLAGCLASVVEAVWKQRLTWSTDSKSSTSKVAISSAITRQKQPHSCSTFRCECDSIWRSTSDEEPKLIRKLPSQVYDLAWQRHKEVSQFYTWTNVAERTEKVYITAMLRPRQCMRECIFAALNNLGPIAGKVVAIAWMIEWLFLNLLEWLFPADFIDRVPFFNIADAHTVEKSDINQLSE